ncbi:MAG TPA: hypothetical protein VK445_00035, partial [Dissulfurispiraceae bacterium]|nr:hypothetical protein [Dissulfurispiraceae bacterium]
MKKIYELIEKLHIPKEVASNLIVSVIAIVMLMCAAVAGVLANQHLDRKLSDARQKLDEHKSLAPLYEQ